MKRALRNHLIRTLARRIRRPASRDMRRVLCYHSVASHEAEGFLDQMKWIAAHARPRSLDDLWRKEEDGPLRVAVTFDDGYADFFDHALPALEAYRIPATVFVPSGVLAMDESERRDFARRCIGIERPLLSGEQLRELALHPLISIGSHSHSHADLGRLRDPDRIRQETVESIDLLEKELGVPVRHFAYPFGDFTNCSRRARAKVGGRCRAAYTIVPGFLTANTDHLRVPRDSLSPSMDLPLFSAWIAGAYDPLKRCANILRKAMLG